MRKRGFIAFEALFFSLILTVLITGMVWFGIGVARIQTVNMQLFGLRAFIYRQWMTAVRHRSPVVIFIQYPSRLQSNNEYLELGPDLIFGFLAGALGPPSKPIEYIRTADTFAKHCITISEYGVISPGSLYLNDIKHKAMYALTCGVQRAPFIRLYHYAHNRKWEMIW